MELTDLSSALVGSTKVPFRPLGRFEPSILRARCVGEVVTVDGTGGGNRTIYRGLAAARPGSVLLVALGGSTAAGHWGGLLTRAALRAGLAGVVIDGSVRDRAELAQLGLPVFFRGLCPVKAGKDDRGSWGETVLVDGVEVRTGDIVVADADGVLVFDAADREAMLAAAGEVLAAESGIEARLRDGDSIDVAFGLADP